MLIKVKCEYCGNEDLVMSDIIHGFYCNRCDDDLTMSEVDIVEEVKTDKADAKINKIHKFISDNVDEECGCPVLEGCESLYDLINEVCRKFNVKLELVHTGGFDSAGYDIDCYAYAGIVDGELCFGTLIEERY